MAAQVAKEAVSSPTCLMYIPFSLIFETYFYFVLQLLLLVML